MKPSVPLKVRKSTPAAPSAEVERAKGLYLRALRRRVRDGSYLTPRRLDTALARLLAAAREDLPDER